MIHETLLEFEYKPLLSKVAKRKEYLEKEARKVAKEIKNLGKDVSGDLLKKHHNLKGEIKRYKNVETQLLARMKREKSLLKPLAKAGSKMGKTGKIAAGVGVAAGLAAGAYGIDRKLKREKARKEIANKLSEIYSKEDND